MSHENLLNLRTMLGRSDMKAGSCSVCSHPQRDEIDVAHVSGVPLRELAKRFDRNKDTIAKHVKDHIPAAVQAAAAVDAGSSILERLRKHAERAERVLAKAEAKHDYRTAVAAIRELREQLKLEAELLGQVPDPNRAAAEVAGETLLNMAKLFVSRRDGVQTRALPSVTVGIQPTTPKEPVEE